ncbi:MAG: HYR domain-containing protein, partial [bacterium]|nr:HYR domain-containing protein [bacterium]
MKKSTIVPLIRQIGLSVVLLWCSFGLLNAQITFASSTCGIASTTLQPEGDNGNGRNVFEFDDGNIVRAEWDGGQNRWEINLYSGDGMGGFTFCCTYVYNTSASLPNPPDLTLGTWESDFFGMDCTASGFVLSGDVQSELTAGCNDTEDPVITCPADITVDNDPGQCSAVVGIPNPNVSDDCPGVSFEYTPASGTAFEVGTTTVTATATDASDHTATCTFDVTVNDVEAPAAACQDITVNLGTSGVYNLNPNEFDGGSTDNCGALGFGINTTVFDCSDLGETFPIELSVTDNAGNFALCTANVTVEDNHAPTVTCVTPVNIPLDRNNDPGVCFYTAQGTEFDATAIDNCGVASLTNNYNNAGTLTGATFPLGTTQVRWTALDATGNLDTCSIKIRVADNTPPIAVCTDPTVNLTSDGTTTVAAAFFDGGSSAVCPSGPVPGGGLDFSASMTAFDCDDVGNTYDITLTVTSLSSGLTDACTASVTVEDPNSFCCAPPMAVCEDITVQLDASGIASITPADIGSGSTAGCGLQLEMLSDDTFECTDVGSGIVTYTITDINGDSDDCTAMVIVEDNIKPVPVCFDPTVELQPNGLYTLLESDIYDAINSSDNCSIASVDFPGVTYTCDDAYQTFPVVVTIEDPSGNTGQCTAMVTVEIGTALPPEWTANDIGDQGDGSFYEYDPCVNDNPNLGDFTIGTGGYNLIPQNADNLAFASVPLCGNGGIQARIKDVVGGYAGLMIRESSDPGSKMIAVYSNLTNLLRREIRYTQNGPRSSNTSYASFPEWLRLTRQGDLIRAFYRNTNGGSWVLFHQAYLPMSNCVEM